MDLKSNNQTVHIIGAGISGIGSAHYLKKAGFSSVLFEESDRIGGRAGFITNGNGQLETGGKNFSSIWPLFNQILQEFKLEEIDNQHPNFHILLGGKLMKFSKKVKISEAFSMLRGIGVKGCLQFLNFLRYVSHNRQKLNHTSGLIEKLEDKFDSQPITNYFTKRLAYGPLRMFSIIMGGAEPDETYYSNLALLLSGFGSGSHHSITGGIGKLFAKLSAPYNIQLSTRVNKIVVKHNKVVGLNFSSHDNKGFVPTDKVISSVPLNLLRTILELPPQLVRETDKIRYFPVILINAEYEKDVFNGECNSIMFDHNFHLGHCSANRLYKKNSVRFTLSGKKGRSILDKFDEELIDLAEKEFSSVLPITSKRKLYHVQRHPGGICAYGPNFTRVKRKITDHIAGIKGLEIAGDYLEGHCMEQCLRSAKNAVNALLNKSKF